MSVPARSALAPVSQIVLVLGLALLVYMIAVEGEPGAVPLLLIAAGASGWIAARRRGRRDASAAS